MVEIKQSVFYMYSKPMPIPTFREMMVLYTPLFMPAQKGHSDIVNILLQADANSDLQRDNVTTPLFMAAQDGPASTLYQLYLSMVHAHLIELALPVWSPHLAS